MSVNTEHPASELHENNSNGYELITYNAQLTKTERGHEEALCQKGTRKRQLCPSYSAKWYNNCGLTCTKDDCDALKDQC